MIYDTSQELEVNKLLSRLDALLSKKCIIELKEKKKARTVSQNSYLHVCITLFAIESGDNLEDAKQLLKRACHFMHTFDGDKIKTKLTRDLNKQELTDFIDSGRFIPRKDFLEKRPDEILQENCSDLIQYKGGYFIQFLNDGTFFLDDQNQSKELEEIELVLHTRIFKQKEDLK